MSNTNKAIWVLVAALVGAIGEVPGIFLNRVIGMSFTFAAVAFVIVSIVSARKNRKSVPA